MLRKIEVEPGVLLGYKVFPGSQFVTSLAGQGQSEADWSGLYAQFNVQHAVAYLPNHFDRGHEAAMLVSIRSKRAIKCLLYKDAAFGNNKVSSADKAASLRRSIAESIPSSSLQHSSFPLLQSIGECLESVVVMYDAEDLECAIPHCMLNDENFTFSTLAVLERDPVTTWAVKTVTLGPSQGSEVVRMSKEERSDMRLLASRLEHFVTPTSCEWISEYALDVSAELEIGTQRMLCYGDSLTAGYYRYGSEFQPYGDTVQCLARVTVDSVGMSGWTTDEMVQNASCENNEDVVGFEASGLNKLLQARQYDVVCLMAGTNDLGMGVALEDIKENLSTLVNMCLLSSSNVQVAVLTVPPTGAELHSEYARTRRAAVNAHLAGLAADRPDRVTLVDGASVLPNPGERPDIPTFESEAWDNDFLHLSPTGSQCLGKFVFTSLLAQGIIKAASN